MSDNDKKGPKTLTEEQRKVAESIGPKLDPGDITRFSVENNGIPVWDQIAAAKRASSIMGGIRLAKSAGNILKPLANLESVRDARPSMEDDLEERRAAENSLLMQENVFANAPSERLSEKFTDNVVTFKQDAEVSAVAPALQAVTIVGEDSVYLPAPTLRIRMLNVARQDAEVIAPQINGFIQEIMTSPERNPQNLITLARLANKAQAREPSF